MVRKGKAPAKRQPRRRMQVQSPLSKSLDAQAMCWARLLADPCSAPLCHPVYAGGNGGILARFENSYNIGFGVGETAGIFSWAPGNCGQSSAAASGIVVGTGANSSTALTLANAVPTTVQPGYQFLIDNSSGFRCVSACMQIFYLGTESNRSGVVSYGNLLGGVFNFGNVVSADAASNVFEHFERTPLNHLEVKFRPSSYDQTWTDATQNRTLDSTTKYGAMGFSFAGVQAAAGFRVRLVAVYEYIPVFGTGQTANVFSRNTSGNTMDDVINYLDRLGKWTVQGGRALARIYSGVQTAAPYVRAVTYQGMRAAAIMA